MKYERYQRQMILYSWGEKKQKKLGDSKVLIAGTGGLGCYVSIALASAGVGYIRLVDHDVVKVSNLNRQILFNEKDIGKKKVEAAASMLKNYNSEIEIDCITEKITEKNFLSLTNGVDVIIDCLDNFETRYLLNRACMKHDIPLIHGAIYGFEGRLTFILPRKTPCLKCIYPSSSPEKPSPAPAVATTCGVIGSLQANEAIKYLTDIDKLLTNKILIYDGEFLKFNFIKIKKREKCEECGN